MYKKATYIEEQIKLLQQRGMEISNIEKAKEILLDIGYYRLGFYTFPFELYPNSKNRTHQYKTGTNFDKIIDLYYFDHDLRHILLKYISRIEVNIRTFITYTCSNHYKNNPTWFVSPKIVKSKFRDEFENKIYATLQQNPCIANHHKKYINDKYAPAWKTLEFMTLGSIVKLYENIIDENLKLKIAQHYKLNTIALFENYIQTIKVIRNACAHGNHIFDLKFIKAIKKGNLQHYNPEHRHDIYSGLLVLLYFLRIISENREQELKQILKDHIQSYENEQQIKTLKDFFNNTL